MMYQQLERMLAEKDFSRLGEFRDPLRWSSLSAAERELMATLFLAQGEEYLKQGSNKVFEEFAIASAVDSENPHIFYQQAVVFSKQEKNLRCLKAASQALSQAVSLNETFFDAWVTWGNILVCMGKLEGESCYYQEAEQKFNEALLHADTCSKTKLFDLHWHWGVCWHLLGQVSGEAHDFHCALEKYRIAGSLEVPAVAFWNDFGNALIELASLLRKKELFLEAIELFRKVINTTENHFQGWLSLSCAYLRVFELDREGINFQLANEGFTRAAELNENCVDLWIYWGRLYVLLGKIHDDVEALKVGSEKFARANNCEENHPLVLSFWSESQMLCGIYMERLDLLRSAEEKIVKSLELHPDASEAWRIYGACLIELGRYFSDESFYLKAIEKFRYGLTLNPKHPLLWYGLSLAHFAIGDMKNDTALLEESVRFCSKAMECGGEIFSQFWNDWGVALLRLAEASYDQQILESAIEKFEQALGGKEISEMASDCDLEWLYNYACAYDFLGDFTEEAADHEKAIRILSHVIQQDSSYHNARYNLALALTHLGILTDDAESLHKASEQFGILLYEDLEDEAAWNDWGICLLNLARLMEEELTLSNHRAYYDQAEEKFSHAIALGYSEAFYNLACLYSLIGNLTAAMHYMERAEVAKILPPIDDILHDEWLEGLRETADFRNFITLLSNKQEHSK